MDLAGVLKRMRTKRSFLGPFETSKRFQLFDGQKARVYWTRYYRYSLVVDNHDRAPRVFDVDVRKSDGVREYCTCGGFPSDEPGEEHRMIERHFGLGSVR